MIIHIVMTAIIKEKNIQKTKLKIQSKLLDIDPIVVTIIPDKNNLGKVGIVKHTVLSAYSENSGMIVLFKTLVKEPYLENVIITNYTYKTSKNLKKFIVAEKYMTIQEFLSYLFDEKIETKDDLIKVALKNGLKVLELREEISGKYMNKRYVAKSKNILLKINNILLLVVFDYQGKPIDVAIYQNEIKNYIIFDHEIVNVIGSDKTLTDEELNIVKAIAEEDTDFLIKCVREEELLSVLEVVAEYGYVFVNEKYVVNVEELKKKYQYIKDKIKKAKDEYVQKAKKSLKKELEELLKKMIDNCDKLIISLVRPELDYEYYITINYEESTLTFRIPDPEKLKEFKVVEFEAPINIPIINTNKSFLANLISELDIVNQLYNKIFDIVLLLEELLYEKSEEPKFINHNKLGKIVVLNETLPEFKNLEDVIKMLKDNNINLDTIDAVVLTTGEILMEYGSCSKYFPIKKLLCKVTSF